MEIRTGRRPSPRRTLLYGTKGIGKSTFASKAPGTFFIPTEDGLDDIDCQSCPPCQSYGDAMAAIAWLYTAEHSYRHAVIDSADWLERLIHRRVCEQRKAETIEDIPYGKGFVFALPFWQEILDGLAALRSQRGMAITLLAHAEIEKFRNPETDSYDRYQPSLHKSASAMIQEWCDEILFATYKVYTTQTDEGFNRQRTRPTNTSDRVLRTVERPAFIAKNRLGMPEELPFNFDEYAKYLPPASPAGEPTAAGA